MKPVNIPSELTVNVSYLAGVISGDGTLTKYFIKVSDRKKANIDFLKELSETTFMINSSIRQELENKWIIKLDSRKLVDYFNKTFEIPIGREI